MIQLASPELVRLAGFLGKYDIKSTVSQLSGLLTAPTLQANTLRIEILVHLAVIHCCGKRKPGLSEIRNWLNRHLGNGMVTHLEDPVEDVFITNVETSEGNHRVFEGLWESSDYFLQVVLDTLSNVKAPQECSNLLEPAFALLRLSDGIAERLNLQRWCSETSIPMGAMRIAPTTRLDDRARAVTFTQDDLRFLGVSRETLDPFILKDEDRVTLRGESIEHTSLEKCPLLESGSELIFTLPHAASPAIRRFVLSELRKMGYLQKFETALYAHQAQQVEKTGLWELKCEAESLSLPEPDSQIPPLHSWLLKIDTNQYIHVVLLHDRLHKLEERGISSIMQYPEAECVSLGKYLGKVSRHCQSLPYFVEGLTLLIVGGLGRGLGRGYVLDFKDLPDNWGLSIIRISDLLMLAGELERPITRFFKCIKQMEWANKEGVYILNVNGDYNFYCYWRHCNYQLVPRELPIKDGSVVMIENDMVFPIRQEIRKLMDRHAIQTISGSYSPVMRFGRDAYFRSIQSRPIYVSLDHLRTGVLAGAVETPRGPSWLRIIREKNDTHIRRLLYEMWSGFLSLYDKLVFEVEELYPEALPGAIEIRLNFDHFVVPENYAEPRTSVALGKPEVVVNLNQKTAEVKFPSDFLMHFQQPENTGEKIVIRAIADGLTSIHQGITDGIDEAIPDRLMNKVVGDSGARVLHLFHTYYPIEFLLSRQNQKPIFLANEDYVFSKLRLSESCAKSLTDTSIKSKPQCNEFLHKVVAKIWNQLREQLGRLDRASVIHDALRVHEAVTQDRDHWRRTAQAILSLYNSEEDVVAVAQDRERERNNVSLPTRTILEMAVCECPLSGGRQLSRWELDGLLAKAALLIEVAMDSDAINSNLIEQPRINLHLNGEYTIDRNFNNTVIKPFWAAYYREEFGESVEEYPKLYRNRPPTDRKRVGELFSSDFTHAFYIEFGLTPDEAIDGLAELMNLAVEHDNVVVQTTLGNLKTRLTTTRGLSSEASEAFIRTFSIFHRPAWDQPPPGFRNKDINPWRFRRRLSATARPILVFGEEDDNKVFFGVSLLRSGIEHLLGRSEQGHLPNEFFKSKEMKRYTGRVSNIRGHEFGRKVACDLRQNGWETCAEVQMTQLGAPTELGDVDVLAWKSTGEVWIIECKRLQLARTVAEIAEICRRFRGEARDELDKHIQRINWIKTNSACLQGIVGFLPDSDHIDDRLVTNTHVPMMYLGSLPIRADKIGPLDSAVMETSGSLGDRNS